MRPIVDLHTHFFGPVYFETLAAQADPQGDPSPGLVRLADRGIDVPRGSVIDHARRWIAEMDRAGVERMVTFASLPEEATSVAEGAAASGGRLVPFCLVHPAAPGSVERIRYLAGDLGFRGLVLFPAMHKVDLSDPALDPFYREAETHRLPLVIHLGRLSVPVRDVLGLPSDFDASLAVPARLRGAAARHPRVRFVVPHFGGTAFHETLALARDCPNISLDTSSSNAWLRREPGLTLPEVFRRSLEAVGPTRIHFGTDSSVFPRGWRDEIYAEQKVAMDALGLSGGERAAILGGNTLALLAGGA